MLVLGLDFESQCDKPETTRITEVGAVLADFQPGQTPGVLETYSTLCWEPNYPPQSEAIIELTGITDWDLKNYGRTRVEAFEHLLPMVQKAEVVVAHNKSFDQKLFETEYERQGRTDAFNCIWLCTLTEVPYPEKYTCKKLSHLAWEHDIPVDRSKLHRSVYDVKIMLDLLAKYDLQEVLKYASEPWIYLLSNPMAPWKDNGVEVAKVKKMGFFWQKYKGDEREFQKTWVKRVKQSQVKKEQDMATQLGVTLKLV